MIELGVCLSDFNGVTDGATREPVAPAAVRPEATVSRWSERELRRRASYQRPLLPHSYYTSAGTILHSMVLPSPPLHFMRDEYAHALGSSPWWVWTALLSLRRVRVRV